MHELIGRFRIEMESYQTVTIGLWQLLIQSGRQSLVIGLSKRIKCHGWEAMHIIRRRSSISRIDNIRACTNMQDFMVIGG